MLYKIIKKAEEYVYKACYIFYELFMSGPCKKYLVYNLHKWRKCVRKCNIYISQCRLYEKIEMTTVKPKF